ncbi:NADH-quinone oxidoreductase subunit E [Limimaricola variabilis]|uniref:NADH-quinone oxidoreductase subunit E n=1 Tax=Limimaricola variabilis TaxID=1492771 RepID=A0ABR6HRY0_9RHOB|nr:hypothetical protein [Limimaricola variabilis]MBB3713216.1 NADH-quinone oxidoreductase subunit E [Limimaricola variabilis]
MNGLGNCRTITIGGAALGGVLLWILLALGERGWFSSLLIAALLAAAGALLALALVCRDDEPETENASAQTPAPTVDRKDAVPAPETTQRDSKAPQSAPAKGAAEAETGGRHTESVKPKGGEVGRVNDSAVLEGGDDDAASDEGDLGEEVSRTEDLDRAAAEADDGAGEGEKGATSDLPMPDGVAADMREKPELLDAPRGQADDLKQLRGVGPRLEEQLNRLGVWHLRQIASWSEGEAAWVDDHLEGFKGRILRDDWIGQARELTKDEA